MQHFIITNFVERKKEKGDIYVNFISNRETQG